MPECEFELESDNIDFEKAFCFSQLIERMYAAIKEGESDIDRFKESLGDKFFDVVNAPFNSEKHVSIYNEVTRHLSRDEDFKSFKRSIDFSLKVELASLKRCADGVKAWMKDKRNPNLLREICPSSIIVERRNIHQKWRITLTYEGGDECPIKMLVLTQAFLHSGFPFAPNFYDLETEC